jgi:phosphatidylglycerol:prolipoprotein diacylglycerol transferase
MMFLAVVVAIAATIWRARRRSIDPSMLAPALISGLLCGWFLSRAEMLVDPVVRKEGWRVFSPFETAGGSLTFFGAGAALGVLIFLRVRREPILPVADVVAPSILYAVGIAKIGCLMAGCCAGATCPRALGIAYPYGSIIHEHQFMHGQITLPDELVLDKPDPKRRSRLLGHLQVLRIVSESPAGTETPEERGRAITPELTALAAKYESLPVYPVPIAMSVAALLCGVLAEYVFRTSRKAGATIAFVLIAYGAMRLGMDWLLADRGAVWYGLSSAQWAGVMSILAGCVVWRVSERSVGVSRE